MSSYTQFEQHLDALLTTSFGNPKVVAKQSHKKSKTKDGELITKRAHEKSNFAKCSCGKKMSKSDGEFWGECEDCRKTEQDHSTRGKDAAANADRHYHGGQFHDGEW
jgi:hypothetical protein